MYLTDPSTGLKSVSLTLLVLSVAILIITGVLQITGVISSLGPFTELCYSSIALYFGRKLNIGGKAFTSEQAASVAEKAPQ